MMLYQHHGVLGHVRVAELGDRVTLTDEAWAGLEGQIIKLDRGRKRCCVEFRFAGQLRQLWVGYEMVQQQSEEIILEEEASGQPD